MLRQVSATFVHWFLSMFKNFCGCNAAVSDLYDRKSKTKIAVVFFS